MILELWRPSWYLALFASLSSLGHRKFKSKKVPSGIYFRLDHVGFILCWAVTNKNASIHTICHCDYSLFFPFCISRVWCESSCDYTTLLPQEPLLSLTSLSSSQTIHFALYISPPVHPTPHPLNSYQWVLVSGNSLFSFVSRRHIRL